MSMRTERPINPMVGHTDEAHETLDWYGKRVWTAAPSTPVEALMEAPPHVDPVRSREEYADLRETLGAAIDALPPRERECFEAVVIERATYRQIADRLGVGVATVDRLKSRAIVMLREQLGEDCAQWLRK